MNILEMAKQDMKGYGEEVLKERAIPDFRDGLKPVHRRILWSCYELGLHHTGGTKKCARIVGDCLGKFHPHGDQSVYQALVGMATSNAQEPLIHGQGNYGGVEDAPAAMRYCIVGNTPLFTNKGVLFPEDMVNHDPKTLEPGFSVDIEDRGLTTPSLNSKSAKITKWIYSGIQPTVIVHTENGHHISVTGNEPFLVATKTGFIWKDADQLEEGDFVCRSSQVISGNSSHMSLEEAMFTGLMLADGWVGKYELGFNSNSKTVNDFMRRMLTEKIAKPKERVDTPEKNKNINKPIRTLEVYGKVHSERMAEYGMGPGSSKMRTVPKSFFEANVDTVRYFLRGFCEGEGSVTGGQIFISSSSYRLLNGIRILLLAYFGVNASLLRDADKWRLVLSGIDNVKTFVKEIGFISLVKKRKAKTLVEREVSNTAGNSKRDIVPFAEGSRGSVHKTRAKFRENFARYSSNKQKAFQHLYESGYSYSRVTKVVKGGRRPVYDLTVKGTHAFTADGYILHNTEAKLSAYADKYLLDPNYLAVMPMVPNYDYTEKEPIYLPSKLPNIFIMGTEGIAYGCSNFMPTFSRASVVALVKKALTGSEINGKLLLKTLKFKFTQGGVVCSSNKEIRNYFDSGVGRLEFTCEVSKGKKDNILVVDTLAPRIKPSKLEAQMNALKDVANVDPVKTRTNPHWFEVTIKKSADCKAVIDKIRNMATTALNFQTYVTHRHDDGSVTFKKTTPVEILEDWIAWRLDFEKKVLARLIGLEEAQINRYNWLIWACNNLKLIMQALESKNPDEFLRKKGKLSAEAVEFILSQQVRRLAKLELGGLKEKLKDHTKKCKSLNKDLKSKVRLVSRVLATLEK